MQVYKKQAYKDSGKWRRKQINWALLAAKNDTLVNSQIQISLSHEYQ